MGHASPPRVRHDLASSRDLMSVGILLTPRHDGLRPWETTMNAIDGDLELTPAEVQSLARVWNTAPSRPAE